MQGTAQDGCVARTTTTACALRQSDAGYMVTSHEELTLVACFATAVSFAFAFVLHVGFGWVGSYTFICFLGICESCA